MRKTSIDLPPRPGAERFPADPYQLSLDDLLAERDPELRWERAFGAKRPLRLEIGVGNSDFLIEVALREPGYNYLGFEYSPKRVDKFLRRGPARPGSPPRNARVGAGRGVARPVGPGRGGACDANVP